MGSSKLIRIIITFINKSIEKVVILITTVIKKGYGIFIYLFIILGIIAIYILFYLFFISDQDLYIDIEVEKASYFEIKVSDSDELRINREIEDISKLIIKNIRQLVIIYDNDTKFQQASINNTNKPIATPLPNVIIAPKNKVLRDIKEVQIIKTNNSKNGFSLKLDGNSIGGYLDADSLNGVTFVFDNCEEHRVFTLISDLVCESSFSLDILEPISIIFSFKNKNNKQEIPIQKGKLLINHVSNDLTNNFSIEVTLFKEDNFKLVDIPVKEICFEKKDEDGNYLPTVEKGLIDIFYRNKKISVNLQNEKFIQPFKKGIVTTQFKDNNFEVFAKGLINETILGPYDFKIFIPSELEYMLNSSFWIYFTAALITILTITLKNISKVYIFKNKKKEKLEKYSISTKALKKLKRMINKINKYK